MSFVLQSEALFMYSSTQRERGPFKLHHPVHRPSHSVCGAQ